MFRLAFLQGLMPARRPRLRSKKLFVFVLSMYYVCICPWTSSYLKFQSQSILFGLKPTFRHLIHSTCLSLVSSKHRQNRLQSPQHYHLRQLVTLINYPSEAPPVPNMSCLHRGDSRSGVYSGHVLPIQARTRPLPK